MLRILRASALAATVLCVAGGVAKADPLPVADVTQFADTDDGWHLSAALTRMTIDSVPNMAATAFTSPVAPSRGQLRRGRRRKLATGGGGLATSTELRRRQRQG